MTRRLLLVAATAAALAGPLAAQAPAERAALEALRDSLVQVTDSGALRRREAAIIEVARRDRNDPLIHLRLGFVAYRLGQLTGRDQHYDDAAGEFEWAGELRPEWPYPWYGLGLAELALGEHTILAIENIRQQLGKDYLSKAARAFARAAQADPRFARAAIDLATTALAQRIRPRLDVALEAVRLAAAAPGVHPDLHLARGRVEREVGEADSALVAFHAYLATGGDSGVGWLEMARSAYYARRPGVARRAYFAGARAARSPEAVALYREDLSWVATPAELGEFDALAAAAARAEWLERFWERRDALDAREPGERLAEHYRRWFHARRGFRLVSTHRHYDVTEVYRAEQREFDDRGVIYLRHGEPDERARFVRPGVEPNESWLYHRPGGDLVFHFVARDDVQDFKLVESLVDVLGFDVAVRAPGDTLVRGLVSSLYDSRSEFGPLYRRVGGGSGTVGSALAMERRDGRRHIAEGTTSDSYRHRFELPLGVVASEFVVGRVGTDAAPPQVLHIVFAVPGARLTPEPAGGGSGVLYPLRFRLVVTDSGGQPVARLDTVRVFTTREPLGGATYLVGQLVVPVPSGVHAYRLLVAPPDGVSGDVIARDSVAVTTLDGRRFAVSDLVLGREGSGLEWTLPRDTVLLNPLGRFPEGGVAELYYEVYGLQAGTPYHTVVRLEREGGRSVFAAIGRLFGGGRAPVLLEFDAAADGAVSRIHRALDLRDTRRGAYRLSVVITDPSTGRSLTRTRRFEIVAAP